MAGEVHIKLEDVHKSYGSNHVLRGVDMEAYRGRINVVIGGSGAGKTVLMRQVIALEKPDSGRIFIDGEDITGLGEMKLGPVRRKFGMVFQHAALFDSMSTFDNVAFPLREHTKLGRKEIRDRVMQKLAILGLEGAHDRYPSDLSGGMRKRVGVARALILEPQIIIYDEPTTGLDPVAARNVDRLIAETAEKFDVTSLVISHDMTTTFAVGDHISLLYQGVMRFTGTADEIMASDDPEVIRFLSSSGVDPASVERLGSQPVIARGRES